MTANEIVSYYDNRYEITSIKDEDGKDLKYTIDNNYSKNGYKKVVIEANQEVAHQKQRNIYMITLYMILRTNRNLLWKWKLIRMRHCI